MASQEYDTKQQAAASYLPKGIYTPQYNSTLPPRPTLSPHMNSMQQLPSAMPNNFSLPPIAPNAPMNQASLPARYPMGASTPQSQLGQKIVFNQPTGSSYYGRYTPQNHHLALTTGNENQVNYYNRVRMGYPLEAQPLPRFMTPMASQNQKLQGLEQRVCNCPMTCQCKFLHQQQQQELQYGVMGPQPQAPEQMGRSRSAQFF